MDLDKLISDFQGGDERAFSSLYSMYNENIHGVVYNIVRNDAIAQDVTQEVFVKVWNNSASYNPGKGRFFTWILNIARNAAIDKIRSKDFRTHSKNLDATIFVDILEAQSSAQGKINAIGLDKFVKKLTDRCINLIEILYFKGFTQKEASETLEIPIGTVKTRIRNCIKELRRMVL